MSAAIDLPIRFRVGARTLLSVKRRLVRVATSLDQALAGSIPDLPPLPTEADGYSLLSAPIEIKVDRPGMIVAERQRYRRWYLDLTLEPAAYRAGLSGNLRSTLKRKGRKIAEASGGTIDVRRFRTPAELDAFHAVARPLAAATYQERLLGMGLPDDSAFLARMRRDAAADQVRAWLLYVGGEPAAYLYCPVRDGTVVYEYVGHDARFDPLSVGTILMAQALADLMDEGIHRRFDFTEGEGQHKRQFATGHVECRDLFLLRDTWSNRATMLALRGFDRGVAWLKRRWRR